MRVMIGNSRKRIICLSVVLGIVLKNSVESCGSDEVLPLIAGLLFEYSKHFQDIILDTIGLVGKSLLAPI